MNRLELRNLVKSNVGGRTDKDTVINAALEEGLKQSARLHFFRSLLSESNVVIADEDDYISLPDNTYQLVEARLIDGTSSYAIEIKSKKWIVERWPNVADVSPGKPTYGYIEDNKLYLYPISNGDYTVRITVCINPSFSSSDTTSNPIPALDMALVSFATAYVMKSLQMFELAQSWDAEYIKSFTIAQSGDRKGPEVFQLQPFGSKVVSSDPGLSYDLESKTLSGRLDF